MNNLITVHLFFVLIFFVEGFNFAFAYEKIITPINIELDPVTREIWRKDLFQTDEIIVIADIDDFFMQIEKKFNNPKVLKFLKHKIVRSLPEKIGPLYSLYSPPIKFNSGFLMLSQEEKNVIPNKILNEIMYISFESGFGPPALNGDSLYFQNITKQWTSHKGHRRKLKSRLLHLENRKVLPLSPETWSYIHNETKDDIIEYFIERKNDYAKKALQISFKIHSENDIEELLKKYSSPNNYKKNKRQLLKLLKESSLKEIIIPLEDILSPFIRENINTFDNMGGPNCFNAGICVNDGKNYETKYVDKLELTESLKKNFLHLTVMEELKTGDLILYKNLMNEYVHVATYIDDDIVFTKNGINKFNPYMFQYKSDMENLYFFEKDFQWDVFRHKKYIKSIMYPRKSVIEFEPPKCTRDVLKTLIK